MKRIKKYAKNIANLLDGVATTSLVISTATRNDPADIAFAAAMTGAQGYIAGLHAFRNQYELSNNMALVNIGKIGAQAAAGSYQLAKIMSDIASGNLENLPSRVSFTFGCYTAIVSNFLHSYADTSRGD